MFTRSDLNDLLKAHHTIGTSLFLPTHMYGRETEQDPIRLKNLIATARAEMKARGIDDEDADTTLAPAVALITDHTFWQHQDLGLALYLIDGTMMTFHVPIPLTEQVVVGPRNYVRPLLPLLADDTSFRVLTMTAEQVELFHATRFALVEAHEPSLPTNVGQGRPESDYENPVQASPVARPNTGTVNISNAQVYGDSPAEWRKGRLVEYARRTAAAVDDILAGDPVPIVLVASDELSGHFSKASTLAAELVYVIDANPAAMSRADLLTAAFAAVRPQLDIARQEALAHWAMLHGRTDHLAISTITDIVTAAHGGAVETLFIENGPVILGHYDRGSGEVVLADATGDDVEDLIETAAVLTLQHGGNLYLASADEIAGSHAAATLRY